MHKGSYFKDWVMKTILCKQLRQLIGDKLTLDIDDIRAAKDNQFFYEFNIPPTDDEIDEFIISSSCFDDEMKEFLLSEVGSFVVEELL
jgi:hypothetical protein